MRLTLHTERLTLRPFELEDAQAMFDGWASDPEVTKYLTWPTHETVETTRRVLGEWLPLYEKAEYLNFAIESKETGQLIGNIAVVGYLEDRTLPVIGYSLSRAHWNKGYMTEACRRLYDAGLGHIHLCPETMGKYSQIGDLQETLDFCLLDERLIPCVDFAHLHALAGGGLQGEEDFARVLDTVERTLGEGRARPMHMHFSTIEFTPAGEKRHRTFAEEKYGPRFEHLAPLLQARGYCGTVICECAGTQADDAMAMQRIWQECAGE